MSMAALPFILLSDEKLHDLLSNGLITQPLEAYENLYCNVLAGGNEYVPNTENDNLIDPSRTRCNFHSIENFQNLLASNELCIMSLNICI